MAHRTQKVLSVDGTTLEDRRVPTAGPVPGSGLGLVGLSRTVAGKALALALDPLDRNGKAKRIAIHNNKTKKAKRAVEGSEPFKAMGRVAAQVVARARERDKQLKAADKDRNLSSEGKDTKRGEVQDSYHTDLLALMDVFDKSEREFRGLGTNGTHPPRTAEEMLSVQQAISNVDQYLPQHSIEAGRLAIDAEDVVLLQALIPKWELAERQGASGQKKHFAPYADEFAELVADARLVTATSEGLAHGFANERADVMRRDLRGYIGMLETMPADEPVLDPERGGVHLLPSFLPEEGEGQ